MARSNEPVWWSLFSAGGVVAAFLMPVTILLTAILIPAGWMSAEQLSELLEHPLSRLYLFVLISLPMFHWAHRFRFVMVDLGFKSVAGVLPIICYATAILVSVVAVFILAI